jgi:hypothetical protein
MDRNFDGVALHGNRQNQGLGCSEGMAAQCGSASAGCATSSIESAPQFGFDGAIAHIKQGGAVRRASWPRSDRYANSARVGPSVIWLTRGNVHFGETDTIPPLIGGIKRSLFDNGDRGTVTRLPNIAMADTSGTSVNGWVPSQADMLAEDWQVN